MEKDKRLDELEQKIDKSRRKIKNSDDKKVVEGTFDSSTMLTIYELLNRKHIDSIGGVIATGKEANVYRAFLEVESEDENEDLKKILYALKIYRVKTSDPRHMYAYIVGDPRFKRIRRKMKDIVFVWAEKEYKNLKRAFDAGVRVPKPIVVKKNLLLMDFIASEKTDDPAPLLKDTKLKDPEKVFEKLFENVKRLYQYARLVHADLSEYNVLMPTQDDPVIIDISQAVVRHHPQSEEFLFRDLKNILNYFKKYDIEIPSVKKAFKNISKL
ncbi:MAG: serine protein kinase RIO [Candidatus Lokiarchaeota archaeon]|nr:serine protein kinase RIO [Candidatus Lokiarchaeota archaeon]